MFFAGIRPNNKKNNQIQDDIIGVGGGLSPCAVRKLLSEKSVK